MRILVTGATGALGSAVIETMLKKIPASSIAILTRKEERRLSFQEKAFRAYLGDFEDMPSLDHAMKDVDKVLLISASDEGDRVQQHRNVVDAAKRAGVAGIAYTSRSLRDRNNLSNPLMMDHFTTEDYIRESGLQYTIFRNALYMDVIPLFAGKQVFDTGIVQSAGMGKVAFALRQEMGEAIAHVMLDEPCENKTYLLTGGEAYSFDDVARALTELSGKEVRYTSVESQAFEDILVQKGIPQAMARKITDFNADIRNGQESVVTADLAQKLGRPPAALKEGLKLLFGL
ncbi:MULTISPECIES: SDR family oxidoreductase [Dyadobacter]|uniref:SDR family oxidoreductase n=1 Tax=Dyadobacter chenhuakuii TaxID=2909339 RepID=A0ABY4XS32_9BACT|nr:MULTISPECIES: SDR family oxidoreductase [Dyadobacter]MCF2492444.1 SDR family oxidoreductase [Dyadobacter chenhuakuii]MCF2517097.1 SDR family oxidoreductase [Dyadobacter sp. CY351]USJ33256.1 SDR family oxidoreductase [Dyadobacter chenhuakuii]